LLRAESLPVPANSDTVIDTIILVRGVFAKTGTAKTVPFSLIRF